VNIGFMGNNLLPARVGEFARAYSLSKMEPVPLFAAFSSLVIERLFDGLIVVLFLLSALALPGFPPLASPDAGGFTAVARTVGMIMVASVLLLLAAVIWPRRVVAMGEAFAGKVLPLAIRRPVVDALEAFLAGVSFLRSPALLTRVALWSVVLWGVNALGFWLAFHAFGLDLSFTAALFFQSCIALAVSVPSGPGFFGPYEYASRLVLVDLWGLDASKALGFALGFHIAGFIPVTLMGLFYAWRLGLSLGDVEASEERVEEEVERVTGVDPSAPSG
jgi:glycosyltransferase 2 family protein